LYKTAVDMVAQNQQTAQCEVLTDSGETLEDSNGHSDTETSDDTRMNHEMTVTVEIDSAVERYNR